MRFIYKCFLILIIFSCINLYATKFPEDEIQPIEEQITLYRQAYQPFNTPTIDPEKDHIPGLVTLFRMGYSYTHNLLNLENDLDGINLLNHFWKETDQAITQNELSLQYFKNTNLRLAFLLSDKKEKSFFFTTLPTNKLYNSGEWKDLTSYSKYYADNPWIKCKKFPFCFEATLYHPQGEISLKTFIGAYLDDLVLGLSALPQKGQGPHHNYVADPAGFLLHDFAHWNSLAIGFEDNDEAWGKAKEFMKRIYEKSKNASTPFDEVGIFLLLHEFNLNKDYFAKDNEEINSPLIPEVLPFSERKSFQNWINGTLQEIDNLANPPSLSFEKLADYESPLQIGGLSIILSPTNTEQLGQNNYRFEVEIDFLKKRSTEIDKNIPKDFVIIALGKAKADVLFSPKSEYYMEDATLQYLTDISLPGLETMQLEIEKISGQKINPNNILQDLAALKDYTRTIESRTATYEAQFFDLVSLMRHAYGSSFLQDSVNIDQIKDKLFEFFKEFYQKYKGLFSDIPYDE